MTLNPTDMKNKSQIAKLLATENITVQHSMTQKTASFDVKHRVLNLPIIEFADDDVYDLFVGHEVAHALFTPPNFVEDLPDTNTKIFHSIFNIVEDNRIERAIQSKYRGLASSFNKGYKILFENDFFGVSPDEVNELGVLDRFNISTKASSGMYPIDIDFTPEEQDLLDEIKSTETWDDVVTVSKKIFDFISQDSDEQPQPQSQPQSQSTDTTQGDPTESDSVSAPSNDMETETPDTDESTETDASSGTETTDIETDSDSDESTTVGHGMHCDDFEVTTQDALDNAFTNDDDSSWYSTKAQRERFVPTPDIKFNVHDVVFTHQQKMTLIKDGFIANQYSYDEWFESAVETYKTWQRTHAKKINHMVKEFELRKSADQHKRTMTHTTGVLDMSSLYKVPISDDVFLSQTITKDGQSHGFVAYVDWSGSMAKHMSATLDQLLMIAGFCRKANIPFHAYAFTNKRFGRSNTIFNLTDSHQTFSLLELFTPNPSAKQWMEENAFIMTIRQSFTHSYDERTIHSIGFPYSPFSLHSTPLNVSLVVAPTIIKAFQKHTGVDIVNFVVLTDGEDGTGVDVDGKTVSFTGGKTPWDSDDTFDLYRRVKATTNATVTVIHISDTPKVGFYTRRFNHQKGQWTSRANEFHHPDKKRALTRQFRTDGYMTFTNNGYDLALVIHPKSMETHTEQSDSTNLSDIKKSFKKTATHNKKVKKMLSTFVDAVA